MDRDQAFAFLGLPDDATHDDIQSRVDDRRRQLELRLRAVANPEQRKVLERALSELEEVRAVAMLDPRDPAAGLPGGAWISLKTGALLADRYVIKARLGVGERGAVYRALDLTWGRDVAVKVLLPGMLLIPGTMDRLAAILRRHLGLSHPAVGEIYALHRGDGNTFIASELVEGETLRQHVARHGKGLSAAAIERLIAPVCAALMYAADKVAHLNLKPENVMVARDGTVKVVDFGLEDVIPTIPRGRSRAMMEQRRFRAPEQVRRSRSLSVAPEVVDERADQFALAGLIYFLATNEAPQADVADLGQKRPDLPKVMVAAVRRGLAAESEARFPSLSAFQAAVFAKDRIKWPRRTAIVGTALVLGLTAIVAGVVSIKPDLAQYFRAAGTSSDDIAVEQQAQALRERTEALKSRLESAERTLRGRLRDARLAVQMREAAGVAADEESLTEARRTLETLESLSVFAVPQVFNNPELLNAYNVLGLAADDIAHRRFRNAVAVLSGAEAVMNARLTDLREAERGTTTKDMVSESAVTARRRFAAVVDQGLILIPAGSFVMGDLVGRGTRAELPTHRVEVASFKIGRTPVTRAQYALCVEAGNCRAATDPSADDPLLPVTGVSWHDAADYAAWLRIRTGEDYRLPSEAEWEYAARAGAGSDFPWGNTLIPNRANCRTCGSAWDGVGPAPVASFAPNAFGLHDVVGNVWQWMMDCWYSDFSSAPANASARDNVACQDRVVRGGSWDNEPWMARLSYRGPAPATLRDDINGFRIAKSVE